MTVKEFGIDLQSYKKLKRVEKKALFYFRVMENYYISEAHKKQKKKTEQEQKKKENEQKLMAQMPRLNMASRRR